MGYDTVSSRLLRPGTLEKRLAMCEKCGCSDSREPGQHRASAVHASAHAHGSAAAELSGHDRLAERNRGFFRAKRLFVINLLSFAGSDAHAFVTCTAAACRWRLQVITPDVLERLQARHVHAGDSPPAPGLADNVALDAHGIAHALDHLNLDQTDILLLENAGSAASQAVHDLGETARVALFSVRDGVFKPLKFPLLFAGAAAVVITGMDQAAAAGFDLSQARAHIAQVAPAAQVLPVAAATGAGVDAWLAFLDAGVKQAKA